MKELGEFDVDYIPEIRKRIKGKIGTYYHTGEPAKANEVASTLLSIIAQDMRKDTPRETPRGVIPWPSVKNLFVSGSKALLIFSVSAITEKMNPELLMFGSDILADKISNSISDPRETKLTTSLEKYIVRSKNNEV